jgi:hypothetical protein
LKLKKEYLYGGAGLVGGYLLGQSRIFHHSSTDASIPPGQIIPPGTTIKLPNGQILKGGSIPSSVPKGTPGQPGASSVGGASGTPPVDTFCSSTNCGPTLADPFCNLNKLIHGCGGENDFCIPGVPIPCQYLLLGAVGVVALFLLKGR